MDKIVYTWANEEKTILLCTYRQADWTWEDFHYAFQTQNALIESVSHPQVHIVVDVRVSQLIPKGGSMLTGINKLSAQKHPRQGHSVIVGAKGLIASMVNMTAKLLGEHRQEIHMVNTFEEAYALLARIMEQQAQKQTEKT